MLIDYFSLLKMCEMDLKLFSGMDVKPGTPPISARSTTPTSSPYRYMHAKPLNLSLLAIIAVFHSLLVFPGQVRRAPVVSPAR